MRAASLHLTSFSSMVSSLKDKVNKHITVVVLQVLGRDTARVKWEAWMSASTFSKEEAMARYVAVALSVVKSRGHAAEGVANAAAASTEEGDTSKLSPLLRNVLGVSGGGGGSKGRGIREAVRVVARGGGVSEATRTGQDQDQEIERLRKHTVSLERRVVFGL